jgi:anti-anti-sigma factor
MEGGIHPVQRDDVLTIQVRGTFNFAVQADFRSAYEAAADGTTHFVVDLEGVPHMDSSALGMLVLLRKRAQGAGAGVSVVNCGEHLLRLFQITNLDTVFEIR